jgi:TolA-binding protein
MSDQDGATQNKSGFRFDRSISLPTIMTVLALLAGWWWWGTQLYADLRIADRENAQEIRTLRGDVNRIEGSQREQAQSVKDDLRDINSKLDRLSDRLLQTPNMKGWVK